MKTLTLLILLSLLSGCATFGGKSGGYEGPQEYAKYFTQGHPEQVVDQTIGELSRELWDRGLLPRGKLLKWDRDRPTRIPRKPVVGWKYGFPLINSAGGTRAVAHSTPSAITIGDDPNYVYKRSLFLHEFGHQVLFYNGLYRLPNGKDHHTLTFFKRHNGR